MITHDHSSSQKRFTLPAPGARYTSPLGAERYHCAMTRGRRSHTLDYETPGEEEPREVPPIVYSLMKIVLLVIALIGATWLVAYVLSIVNPIK